MIEAINLHAICRICLNESSTFVPLFEKQYSIELMIECCTAVRVNFDHHSHRDGMLVECSYLMLFIASYQ